MTELRSSSPHGIAHRNFFIYVIKVVMIRICLFIFASFSQKCTRILFKNGNFQISDTIKLQVISWDANSYCTFVVWYCISRYVQRVIADKEQLQIFERQYGVEANVDEYIRRDLTHSKSVSSFLLSWSISGETFLGISRHILECSNLLFIDDFMAIWRTVNLRATFFYCS